MNNAKLRLKSFTLIEVTISMLLVSILSAFIYYTFTTFNGLLSDQQIKKMAQYEFDMLCHRLQWDSHHTNSMELQDNMLRMYDSLGTIDYIFREDHVLREQYQLRTDTFFVATPAPVFQTQQAGTPLDNFVNSYVVSLTFQDNTVQVPLQKAYSAQQLIDGLPSAMP